MSCNHKWQVLSETYMRTLGEKYMDLVEPNKADRGRYCRTVHNKLIQILTCDKCGEIKRFTESLQ